MYAHNRSNEALLRAVVVKYFAKPEGTIASCSVVGTVFGNAKIMLDVLRIHKK